VHAVVDEIAEESEQSVEKRVAMSSAEGMWIDGAVGPGSGVGVGSTANTDAQGPALTSERSACATPRETQLAHPAAINYSR
jgi:hypothetical protein